MYTIIIIIVIIWVILCVQEYKNSNDLKIFLGDIVLNLGCSIPLGFLIGIGVTEYFVPTITMDKVIKYNLTPIVRDDSLLMYVGMDSTKAIMFVDGKAIIANRKHMRIVTVDSLHKLDVHIPDKADVFMNNFSSTVFREDEYYVVSIPNKTIDYKYFEP